MSAMEGCHTCGLVVRRDRSEAQPWDQILRTPGVDVVHAYNTSLPGWIVIVTRRHLAAIDEMNDAEEAELGPLIRDVSVALKRAVQCAKTYVMQFAEAEGHSHLHFHIVPRVEDLPPENRSAKCFNYLGVDASEQLSDEAMNEVTATIREHLVATRAWVGRA